MQDGWSSAIHAVLNQAIKAGGSSLRDHRQTSGELGYFQHSFQVYDREGKKCESPGCGGSCVGLRKTGGRRSGARSASGNNFCTFTANAYIITWTIC